MGPPNIYTTVPEGTHPAMGLRHTRNTHMHMHAHDHTTSEPVHICTYVRAVCWPRRRQRGSALGTHSPLVAELASEAVEVIHIVPGPHHHLEGWDQLAAGSAVARGAKKPARCRVQRAQGLVRVGGQRSRLYQGPRGSLLLGAWQVGLGKGEGTQRAASGFC